MFILYWTPILRGSCNWNWMLWGGCPECLNNFIFEFVFCKWCLMGQCSRSETWGLVSPVPLGAASQLPCLLRVGSWPLSFTLVLCHHHPALGRAKAGEGKVCGRHIHNFGSWKMAEPRSLPPRLEWHGSLGRWLARWTFWWGAGSCEGLY